MEVDDLIHRSSEFLKYLQKQAQRNIVESMIFNVFDCDVLALKQIPHNTPRHVGVRFSIYFILNGNKYYKECLIDIDRSAREDVDLSFTGYRDAYEAKIKDGVAIAIAEQIKNDLVNGHYKELQIDSFPYNIEN
jgi:hypothetical protein